MNKPQFQIGDEVWIPRARMIEKQIPCPACCGQRALTVIMGDGQHVSIDCSLCGGNTYRGSTGTVVDYQFDTSADSITVESVERRDGGFRYNYHDDVYATKEEALVKAKEMGEKHILEEQKRLTARKENENKTWVWNAGYHRRELKRAQEQVIYHTAKLNVAKVKAKEKE